MEKKYGFITASAMVIGIVIGSGIFFKGPTILQETNENLVQALLAWLITGSIMIFGAITFGKIALTSNGKVSNLLDFVRHTVGKKYAFIVGMFFAVFYYPLLAAVLAWVSADYITSFLNISDLILLGVPIKWTIALGLILFIYILNYVSPKIAGYFQVSTTVIKLIPIAIIAVGGLIYGLFSGQTIESFTVVSTATEGRGIFYAVLATAFAYEGWIIATTIGHEIKNSEKNLPKALLFGSVVVLVSYILFYVGLSSVLTNSEIVAEGNAATSVALSRLLGDSFGNILMVFVIISCLGTTNGLVMGASRGFNALAENGIGFKKNSIFLKINEKTDTSLASNLVGLIFSILALLVWFGNFHIWPNTFIDISELPIAVVYLLYIPMYVWYIKNNEFKNFTGKIIPILALLGAVFIFFAGFTKFAFIPFMLVTALTILITSYFIKLHKIK